MCVSAVSGVSLVGVSLLSADEAVTVVRPRSYLSEFLSPEVEQGPVGKLSSRRTRWANKMFLQKKNPFGGFRSGALDTIH
jgi:hypothetical protein